MTISEKIFQLLEEKGMSQKEFSERTGIAQSSISDWKRKKTNPVAEKILIICEQLDVTPYELLSGTDGAGKRSNPSDMLIIRKDSDLGHLVVDYLAMDQTMQGRLQGYMQALKEINEGSAGVKDHI